MTQRNPENQDKTMKYDLSKLKNKVNELSYEKTEKKGPPFTQWKPTLDESGKTKTWNVRFLPYQDGNGQPFQEVLYYDNKELTPYRLVAPSQFGMEDPIAEFIAFLRKDRKNKDSFKNSFKLAPKPRFFAPVIVREEMEKGVQVWELSPTLCKEIYSVLMNEDFENEDLMDPKIGRDFSVKVSPSGKTFTAPTGKSYPVNDIALMPRQKTSAIHTNAEQMEKITSSIPNLKEIFEKLVKPAVELETLLDEYIAVSSGAGTAAVENAASVATGNSSSTSEESLNTLFSDM